MSNYHDEMVMLCVVNLLKDDVEEQEFGPTVLEQLHLISHLRRYNNDQYGRR